MKQPLMSGEEEQARLRDYIVGVTGEEYENKPDEQGTIGTSQITEPASSNDVSEEEFEELEEITASIEDEELEDLSPLDEDELSLITDAPDEQSASLSKGEALPLPEFSEGDLTPMQFQSKQLIILGGRKEQADLLKQYLEERLGIVVEFVTKKQNLWRLMKLCQDLWLWNIGFRRLIVVQNLFSPVQFTCLQLPKVFFCLFQKMMVLMKPFLQPVQQCLLWEWQMNWNRLVMMTSIPPSTFLMMTLICLKNWT